MAGRAPAGRDPDPFGRRVQAGRRPLLRTRLEAPGARRVRRRAARGHPPRRPAGTRRQLIGEGLAPSTIQATIIPLRAIFRREVARGGSGQPDRRARAARGPRRPRPDRGAPTRRPQLLAALPDADRAVWATAHVRRAAPRRADGAARRGVDLAAGVIHVERGWDDKEGEIETKGAPAAAGCRSRRCCATSSWRTGSRTGRAGDDLVFGSDRHASRFGRRRLDRARRQRMEGGEARADHPARVPPHVRVADDRRRREREGALAPTWATPTSRSPSTATGT